ncbi:hypothetical protein [Nitrosopumilus maritimus]|uniref:Uncharacterized protein n=1 Tax=Nitrosopumilus maritimus (strain SCM1) TaxID=436308 RepID=A9A4P5_NITMS|nr:hypothetical protein [Nitrosopumilus maritimus]ABX13023.1 hypothetical protein Nmar_1127 [Nitrosopumilus maritimus SCM1]
MTKKIPSDKEILDDMIDVFDPTLPVFTPLSIVLAGLASQKSPLHEIPEPDKWKEKAKRGLGLTVVKQGKLTATREGNCVVRRGTHIFKHRLHSICEPHSTVIIVEKSSSEPAGGGATILGSGGSVTTANTIYRVAKYDIGTLYRYEFRVTIKVKLTVCPGQEPTSKKEVVGGGWFLAGVVSQSICKREIIADGIDNPNDAKKVADNSAPKGSGIKRSHSGLGLKDQ